VLLLAVRACPEYTLEFTVALTVLFPKKAVEPFTVTLPRAIPPCREMPVAESVKFPIALTKPSVVEFPYPYTVELPAKKLVLFTVVLTVELPITTVDALTTILAPTAKTVVLTVVIPIYRAFAVTLFAK